MATLGSNNFTFHDLQQRLDPNGMTSKITEILQQQNPILRDAVIQLCNGADKHESKLRSSMPTGTWNRYNKPIKGSKSGITPIIDRVSDLEDLCEVDAKLIDRLKGGDMQKRQVLMQEESAFVEGMTQEVTRTILYGNETTNPDEFNGFFTKLNKLTGDINSNNIANAGGTGADNSSILGVVWDDQTCHLISSNMDNKAVVNRTHYGKDLVNLGRDIGSIELYRTKFLINLGLHIKDWRSVYRIANIDVSNLTSDASGNSANLVNLINAMCSRLNGRFPGKRKAIYMNQTIHDALITQVANFHNVFNQQKDVYGMMTDHIRGIPVRIVDQMLDSETAIS